jgi:hypothetical protein
MRQGRLSRCAQPPTYPHPLAYEPRDSGQEPIAMSEPQTGSIPIFYSCIPNATEGPPIEIAWAMLASEAQGVICESRLIRPPAAWTPELARNPPALQAYELTVSDLRDYGAPIRVIAAHMNATLANRELFSAKVDDDARIRRIFEAAKIAPEFALRKTDAVELIAEMARMRLMPPVALARAKREAEVMCLTGVRAEAQARFLATYWAFVAGRN